MLKSSRYIIKAFILLISLGLFFSLFYSNVIAQECGTTVCSLNTCTLNASKTGCTTGGSTCQFTNCACTTSINASENCVFKAGVECVDPHEVCVPKTCCSSQCVQTSCGWYYGKWVCKCTKTQTICNQCGVTCHTECSGTTPATCERQWSKSSCSGNPPDTCSPQTPCTPVCPVGQVNYNTGSAAPNASCTYLTGATNANGSCATATNTTSCWYPVVVTPPTIVVTGLNGTTPDNCTIAAGNIGQVAFNTTRFTVTYPDSNVSNPSQALMLWLNTDSTAPVLAKIYDTGTPKLQANTSFGLLVKKEAAGWSGIYVPGIENGSPVWIKAGTIGTGLRAEMLGSGGNKAVGIKDVSVASAGGNTTLTVSLQFYNSMSGIAAYEKISDGTYKIFAVDNKQSTFLPSGGNTISSVPNWYTMAPTLNIDLNPPVADDMNYSASGINSLNVYWKYSDSFSPIIRTVGDAYRVTAGTASDFIIDNTQGPLEYSVLASAPEGTLKYNGLHLWSVAASTRTEAIDLMGNVGGSMGFVSASFDRSCNVASDSAVASLGGSAWIATKGGLVFSGSGLGFTTFPLTQHAKFSNDAYWNSPYSFYKDEADITTEIISASTNAVNDLLHSTTVGSVRSLNNFDTNNRSGYWYDNLLSRNSALVSKSPSSFNVLTFSGNLTPTLNVSLLDDGHTTCGTTKTCIVRVSGNLTINSGFSCNSKAVFFVEGSTTINPDVTNSATSRGCYFISRGDITITAGSYKSAASSYPVYDILEGFFLTDGVINAPVADTSRSVRDGLVVHGSLIAFGNSGGRSVILGRSLSALYNLGYPAVAIHFDNRFVNFASSLFGGDSDAFKREVGFKPF